MRVTTWTLESTERPGPPPALPSGVRLEHVAAPTPELARFLYALVGGPWRWTDRLGWTRAQWAAELAVPGTELHVLQADGSPQGYVELQPRVGADGVEVEIRYLGLVTGATGRGWGGALLAHALDLAWTLGERHGSSLVDGSSLVEPVETTRVWVHTCSLDGPAALANYRARGLRVVAEVDTDEDVPDVAAGSWTATTGLPH